MRSTLNGTRPPGRTSFEGGAPRLSVGATLLGAAALAGFVAGRRTSDRPVPGRDGRHSGDATSSAGLRSVERQAFRLLYATRRPVAHDDLGEALDSSLDEIEPHVAELEERGRLIRDGDGRILGVAGLSIKPTQHVIVTDEGPRWTWCAWDALGIGALLGKGTIVRSHCPQTGAAIEVRFKRRRVVGAPNSAVLMMPDRADSCVTVDDWCPLVNLMEGPESARRWMKENGVSADVISVSDAARDAARAYRPLLHPLPRTA